MNVFTRAAALTCSAVAALAVGVPAASASTTPPGGGGGCVPDASISIHAGTVTQTVYATVTNDCGGQYRVQAYYAVYSDPAPGDHGPYYGAPVSGQGAQSSFNTTAAPEHVFTLCGWQWNYGSGWETPAGGELTTCPAET